MCTRKYVCLCCSFASNDRSKKYKHVNDIEAPVIAQKFQSLSGTQIYGVVAWREWCTLERCLTDRTLAWLAQVTSSVVQLICSCVTSQCGASVVAF